MVAAQSVAGIDMADSIAVDDVDPAAEGTGPDPIVGIDHQRRYGIARKPVFGRRARNLAVVGQSIKSPALGADQDRVIVFGHDEGGVGQALGLAPGQEKTLAEPVQAVHGGGPDVALAVFQQIEDMRRTGPAQVERPGLAPDLPAPQAAPVTADPEVAVAIAQRRLHGQIDGQVAARQSLRIPFRAQPEQPAGIAAGQQTGLVGEQHVHLDRVQAVVRGVVGERFAVEPAQAAGQRRQPQVAVVGLGNAEHTVGDQAVGLGPAFDLAVLQAACATGRGKPDGAVAGDENVVDDVVGQPVLAGPFAELAACQVQRAAAVGAQPQRARGRFGNRAYIAGGKRRGVLRIEGREPDAVETHQPVLRAQPEIALAGLGHGPHDVGRQPVLARVSLVQELRCLPFGIQRLDADGGTRGNKAAQPVRQQAAHALRPAAAFGGAICGGSSHCGPSTGSCPTRTAYRQGAQNAPPRPWSRRPRKTA